MVVAVVGGAEELSGVESGGSALGVGDFVVDVAGGDGCVAAGRVLAVSVADLDSGAECVAVEAWLLVGC